MISNTKTKYGNLITDQFRNLIEREALIAKETMNEWQLYEHLKTFIPAYEIELEEAIKMIVEVLEL